MQAKKNAFGSDLIIGVLSFLMVSLSFFSYNEYSENKKNHQTFEQERKVLSHDIEAVFNKLNSIQSENESINRELNVAKKRISDLRDSLNSDTSNFEMLFRVQGELLNAKEEEARLLTMISDLDDENKRLEATIEDKNVEISDQREFNDVLSQQNNKLQKDIRKAAVVIGTAFKAEGIRVKSNGRIVIDDRYRKTEQIRVCFTLAENLLANPEQKSIYVQILSPKNNIIGEKKQVRFKHSNKELTYSTKADINYDKKALDLCVFADASEDELVKGEYFINIFDGDRKIGYTTLVLR